MAETEIPETLAEADGTDAPTQEMEIEAQVDDTTADDGAGLKRSREDAAAENEEESEGVKKLKVEKSVEEERLEKTGEEDKKSGSDSERDRLTLGPKSFGSSVEMFDYFYKFLHAWTPNINVNKYEHEMLLELLKTGHTEPEKKIGTGIRAFQVRYHPQFRSRCFFVIRQDESVDDFSFRKCVDRILPLPENMQIKHDVNKVLGGGRGGKGGGSGRGGGRGHWRGRGGKSRK